MQYFNPALLHKRADSVEETLRKESAAQQNDNFNVFDPLSENYGISNAVEDISGWWGGQGDKATAAGNRALTYFTPRLVGSLGLAAVVSLLAGRKGGIMPALIGAVAGWFLGEPAMKFFQKTFGSKPEDVTKRTEEAKKGNSTEGGNGEGQKNPQEGNKNIEGNNGQQPPQQQPPQQQPTPGNNGQPPAQEPVPQEPPVDDEGLIEEQGGEIPTTGGNPVEDPGAYGLPEDDPDSGPIKQPAPGQPQQPPQQPQQPSDEEELIREWRRRAWERQQEQELEQELEQPMEETSQPPQQQQQPQQPAPAPAPGNNGQPATGQPKPIPPEPIPPESIPANPEQPAEDPASGGAPNMMGQIKGKVEAAAGGMKQAGGNLLDRIRGKQQPASRPQNPTEARAQMQQPPQQPQQAQRPQMTAEEWQQQVTGRMRIPGMPMKTPEMQLHEYAYNIPEKTAPSYSYLSLGRNPSREELAQAYPDNMVKEYAKSAPFGMSKSPDELRQNMYYNDQRGLMAGRKPQGRPISGNAPAGKFTLKRNEVYNDLLRQHRGQPKVGPYRQN